MATFHESVDRHNNVSPLTKSNRRTRTRQRAYAELLESRTLLAAQIYVTNVDGNAVGQYDSTGAAINTALVPGGGTTYQDVAVQGSDLFVSNHFAGTIGEYSTSGTTINASLVTGVPGPFGVTVSGSQMFVANGDGTIGEYTLGAMPGTIVSSNPGFVTGLGDVDSVTVSGSDLFITDYSNGVVGEYTTSGATVNASLVSGLANPEALAIVGGDLFVTNYGSGTVGEYTLSGTPVNPSLISGLSQPVGIGASGSDLFVSVFGTTIAEYTTSGAPVNTSLISGLGVTYYFTVANTASGPGQVAFAQQPASALAGNTLAPITVDVEDSNGNILTTDNSNVTLAISSGPGGAALGGTTTVAAVNGVATFSDLTISAGGTYTLTASDGAFTAATSNNFTLFTPAPIKSIGALDPTFGTNGLASHNVGFASTAGVALQANGQSVIAGTVGASPSEEFGLTRYNADGTLDTSFGSNGVVTTSFGGTDDVATAVSALSSGDILVAGTATTYTNGAATGSEFAVAEYNMDGSVNTSFGNGTGQVLISFSSSATLTNDVLTSLVVGANSTIYLGGRSNASGNSGNDFALAALNPDGTLDASFGAAGKTLVDFAGEDDSINSLALQANGEIVAAGSATVGGTTRVGLARFLPNGTLDKHFGSKGLVTTNVRGVYDSASSVVVQPKGQIVIGGLSATGSGITLSSDFLVARYTTAGALDRTFGSGGTTITSFGQPSAVTQVVLEADGEIIASGKTVASLSGLNASQLEVAVARYTTNGKLDTSFNSTGTLVVDLSGASATPAAQAAGTGGNIQPASMDSFALATFTVPLGLSPADTASELMAEFAQFEMSAQGVAAVTQGGELLDVGNSGANTVEAAIVTAGVDLAASIIAKLPPAALEGAKGTLTVKITEDSADPASGTITIQLYASPDTFVDPGETPFESFPEKVSLKTNHSRTFPLHYALPSTAGNVYVVADVNTESLAELNVNNNVAPSTSAVDVAAPFVDLAGSNLTSVGTLAAGKTVTISFTVANDGNILARSTAVEILASPDGTVSDGTEITEPNLLLNLAPGASRSYRLTFKIPTTLAADTYQLVADLDPANTLSEPNLTNNIIVESTTFTVA